MKRPKDEVEFVDTPVPEVANKRVALHSAHWNPRVMTLHTLLLGVYLQGVMDGCFAKDHEDAARAAIEQNQLAIRAEMC